MSSRTSSFLTSLDNPQTTIQSFSPIDRLFGREVSSNLKKIRTTHLSFHDPVSEVWNLPVVGNLQYVHFQKLKSLRSHLKEWKEWNKVTFGNIKQQILRMEYSILSLQTIMDLNPTDSNSSHSKVATSTLHNLLQSEGVSLETKI